MKSAVILSFFAILLVTSCNKNESVTKKVEGEWHYFKLLRDDGSVSAEDADYSFSSDGTYSCYTPADDTTIHGNYVVTKKGTKVVFIVNSDADTSQVEDLDKKSMVLRTVEGVHYFKR